MPVLGRKTWVGNYFFAASERRIAIVVKPHTSFPIICSTYTWYLQPLSHFNQSNISAVFWARLRWESSLAGRGGASWRWLLFCGVPSQRWWLLVAAASWCSDIRRGFWQPDNSWFGRDMDKRSFLSNCLASRMLWASFLTTVKMKRKELGSNWFRMISFWSNLRRTF